MRTSFILPPAIKKQAEAAAKKLNISMGEFFRQAIAEKSARLAQAPDFFEHDWGTTPNAPQDGSVRPEKYRFEPARRRSRK